MRLSLSWIMNRDMAKKAVKTQFFYQYCFKMIFLAACFLVPILLSKAEIYMFVFGIPVVLICIVFAINNFATVSYLPKHFDANYKAEFFDDYFLIEGKLYRRIYQYTQVRKVLNTKKYVVLLANYETVIIPKTVFESEEQIAFFKTYVFQMKKRGSLEKKEQDDTTNEKTYMYKVRISNTPENYEEMVKYFPEIFIGKLIGFMGIVLMCCIVFMLLFKPYWYVVLALAIILIIAVIIILKIGAAKIGKILFEYKQKRNVRENPRYYTYEFYENYLIRRSGQGVWKIYYAQIDKVTLAEKNIYLIYNRLIFSLNKNECGDDLVGFLKEVKKVEKHNENA